MGPNKADIDWSKALSGMVPQQREPAINFGKVVRFDVQILDFVLRRLLDQRHESKDIPRTGKSMELYLNHGWQPSLQLEQALCKCLDHRPSN